MSNELRRLGIPKYLELAIVEYCKPHVQAGDLVTREMIIDAIHAHMKRAMALIERKDVCEIIADVTYDRVHARGGKATERVIDDSVIAAAPADGRWLLNKHRTSPQR